MQVAELVGCSRATPYGVLDDTTDRLSVVSA